jgi:predicted NBD/HSP70 family sugar kinase
MKAFHKLGRRPPGEAAGNSLSGLRRRNSLRLLTLLRLEGGATRAELARATGLRVKTVTNLVNLLLDSRLVRSEGPAGRTRGRPAERLVLNGPAAYGVGLDLGVTHLRAVLLDLSGRVLFSRQEPARSSAEGLRILARAVGLIHDVRRQAGPAVWRKVLGIGFASPGFIDRRRGVALEAANLPRWRNVPVARRLAEEFGLTVRLEESTRAMTLAEQRYGRGRGEKDFVVLDLGMGIGAGIVTGGRLYYGATESGGEIGHTMVGSSGTPCRCGRRGCLEAMASGLAIARLSGRRSARGAAEAAGQGDSRARRVIREAGAMLGIAVGNLVNLLNPSLVLFNGGLCQMGAMLMDPLVESLRRHAFPRALASARLAQSELGLLAGAIGAATLALDPVLEYERAADMLTQDDPETGEPIHVPFAETGSGGRPEGRPVAPEALALVRRADREGGRRRAAQRPGQLLDRPQGHGV